MKMISATLTHPKTWFQNGLEVETWLGGNPLLKGMLEAFHFGDKIGYLENGFRGTPPRQDDMLGRPFCFESFEDIRCLEKFIPERDMDLIKDHEIILGIPEKLAAFSPRFPDGLGIFFARHLPRKPAAEVPHSKAGTRATSRGTFKELNHSNTPSVTDHPERCAHRRRRLSLPITGEYENKTFLFHKSPPQTDCSFYPGATLNAQHQSLNHSLCVARCALSCFLNPFPWDHIKPVPVPVFGLDMIARLQILRRKDIFRSPGCRNLPLVQEQDPVAKS